MPLSDYQRDVLTRTVLGEAANQGVRGETAVASVIRNRALSGDFPSDPAAVALAHNSQGYYAFTANADAAHSGNTVGRNEDPNSPRYQEAAAIVDGVFNGSIPDPTGGATYYHTTGSNPTWDNNMYQTARIGAHVFYSPHPVPPANVGNAPIPATLDPFRRMANTPGSPDDRSLNPDFSPPSVYNVPLAPFMRNVSGPPDERQGITNNLTYPFQNVPPLPRERPADLPPPSLTSTALPPMPRPRPATDIPPALPDVPYSVNRIGTPQPQNTVVNGAIARGLDSIPDAAYQPIANGMSGLMGVLAPQQMPPLPRARPSLPDLPPPSLTTSTFAARPDVLAPNTFNSPFVNPGVQGLSPDERNPLPSVPGVIKTTGGIAGTVQMPRNVRPNIGPLPTSVQPMANEALVVGAPIDAPMPLPPPTLTGGLNPQGTIIGQDVTPVVPLPRLDRQPAPVMPLSPPPEELAALREQAQNPLQRMFNATPLGHIVGFAQNLGQAPHYGAPAQGGLLAMLSGRGGVGGAPAGGLLGLLSGLGHSSVTPQQVTAQFSGLTPAQLANQNPLALAAGLAGQTAYSAPNGLLMPTIAMNGNRRNSLADYGNGGSPYAANGSLSSLV